MKSFGKDSGQCVFLRSKRMLFITCFLFSWENGKFRPILKSIYLWMFVLWFEWLIQPKLSGKTDLGQTDLKMNLCSHADDSRGIYFIVVFYTPKWNSFNCTSLRTTNSTPYLALFRRFTYLITRLLRRSHICQTICTVNRVKVSVEAFFQWMVIADQRVLYFPNRIRLILGQTLWQLCWDLALHGLLHLSLSCCRIVELHRSSGSSCLSAVYSAC